MTDNLQAIWDHFFKDYLLKYPQNKEMQDSVARKPSIIIDIAAELGLVPPKNKTIIVTGSKGKGSTTGFISSLLLNADKRVASLYSPEDLVHQDRFRYQGEMFSNQEIIDAYQKIFPSIENKRFKLAKTHYYLSPSGLMLLLFLQLVQRKKVDFFVLETGRGARFDEVGSLECHIGVITSILNEHSKHLGPDLEHILWHKSAVIERAKKAFIPNQYRRLFVNTPEYHSEIHWIAEQANFDLDLPKSFKTSLCLAKAVVQSLGLPVKARPLRAKLHSYGYHKSRGLRFFYEGCVQWESLDQNFILSKNELYHPCFLISFSDDKDWCKITRWMKKMELPYKLVVLDGKKTSLIYQQSMKDGAEYIKLNIDDYKAAAWSLLNQLASSKQKNYYCLGTQSFIRVIKWIGHESLYTRQSQHRLQH